MSIPNALPLTEVASTVTYDLQGVHSVMRTGGATMTTFKETRVRFNLGGSRLRMLRQKPKLRQNGRTEDTILVEIEKRMHDD